MRWTAFLVGTLAFGTAGAASAASTGTVTGQVVSTATARGSIALPKGAKGTFELAAYAKDDGSVLGRLLYTDNLLNFSMQSRTVSSFTPGCKSTVTGTAASNLGPLGFSLTVTDGKAGGGTFSLLLSGATTYSVSGTLSTGRVRSCP